jgi:hypothetical protein
MKLLLRILQLGILEDDQSAIGGLNLLKELAFSRIYCVQVLKKIFVFTGGEIVNEFLISTGYLPGAHQTDCPAYKKVVSLRPAWMKK